MWQSKPKNAWLNYIKDSAISSSTWIEDSSPISKDLPIKKRELFGLIILAHACNSSNESWRVGFDPNAGEPNDGFIIKGENKLRIEHKIVAQMQKEEVLDAIIKVYIKNAKKGKNYGKNRILLIHPNKTSNHGGLIKISNLTEEIGEKSPFDKVITMGLVSNKNGIGIFHLIQHYPRLKNKTNSSSTITQIDFNFITGEANVTHNGFSIY